MIQIPLTPEEFEAKAAALAEKQGIHLPGRQGTIEKMGLKASYVYENGVLTINILDKPFFLSEDMIEKQLREWL
jgi:hypothetical protein